MSCSGVFLVSIEGWYVLCKFRSFCPHMITAGYPWLPLNNRNTEIYNYKGFLAASRNKYVTLLDSLAFNTLKLSRPDKLLYLNLILLDLVSIKFYFGLQLFYTKWDFIPNRDQITLVQFPGCKLFFIRQNFNRFLFSVFF